MYDEIILSGSYLIIFLLVFAVGILGFFPPSKIIYGISGFLASTGRLSFILVIFVGAFGHTLGNFVQYELGKRKGYGFLKKILVYYPLFTINDVKKVQIVFEKKGAWFFLVGKILDPIKTFISFCAGFSKMNLFLFLFLAFIGSLIWALIFAGLGFYFGESYENYGIVGVFIVGFGMLFLLVFYKYMNSKEVGEVLKTR